MLRGHLGKPRGTRPSPHQARVNLRWDTALNAHHPPSDSTFPHREEIHPQFCTCGDTALGIDLGSKR